ncbi:MAG: hypothetical protein FJ291_14290 [Planctomycetes bacterium]|nr:hypothetical protein [Planctomycetota bacterium]
MRPLRLVSVALGFLATGSWALAAQKPRLAIGEFTARKLAPPPKIDGKIEPGEWDKAFTTSGMIAPFEHELQTAETTMALGYDERCFYFLFNCRRTDAEWYLRKAVRENDDYDYGDPSVEIWVTPPTLVPETYQNIINTFPAVLDQKMIPTRGYVAQGWKGNWTTAVAESETHYVLEASIPIKDFGFEGVDAGGVSPRRGTRDETSRPQSRDGDVPPTTPPTAWRFLMCRTAHGAKPRAQASWSVTQAFSEIPQHPRVHLVDDSAVVQLFNVTSVFTGNYRFPITIVAPDKAKAEVAVELRWHKEPTFADGDKVEKQTFTLNAGERKAFEFAGAVPPEAMNAKKAGHFTITATQIVGGVSPRRDTRDETSRPQPRDGDVPPTKKDTVIFRQSFPFVVDGWAPSPKPVRPEKAEVKELDFRAMYGPESNVMIVRADIIDLPGRAKVAGGGIRLLDPAQNNKELMAFPMQPFRHCYSSTHFALDKLRIPVADWPRIDQVKAENARIEEQNRKLEKEGKKPAELKPLPTPEPLKLLVELTVKDAEGKPLKAETKEVGLLRHKFEWSDNSVGITDKVIPPWTPMTWKDGAVGVWNRSLHMNGLGLLKQAVHSGVGQLRNGPSAARPLERGGGPGVGQLRNMRLVAVSGGKAVEVMPSAPSLVRHVDAQVDTTGTGEGGGIKVEAKTRVEFDGFTINEWTLSGKAEKLTLEIVFPEEEATHFCTTAGGWAATHDVTPAYWSSQQTGSGMLLGDFVPYIWLTNSDRAFIWVADNDKGWGTETDRSHPTQEIIRKDGTVTLRIHFVEVPTDFKQPTTIKWAYQTFPSRPLPPGWRSIICANRKGDLLGARNTYFWFDSQADWAVLWPYYSSPYPWSLEKSKKAYDQIPVRTDHRPMVGSIAHAIARYRDYAGHEFPGYVVDWGETPGDFSNGNTTQGKGPNDFRVWHYQKWVRDAGFRGLYVDENYLGVDKNFLTGGAYFKDAGQGRPAHDGPARLQPGYSYLGEREYFKRLKVMFHENGVPAPNLWQHISSGAAYHAWLGDIFFEGENVEPTDLNADYFEVLPAGRLRAIGSAKCAGGVMTMMCQSSRHATVHEPKHTHQFVGWVMAHDVLPEQVPFYSVLAQEALLYEDNVEFFGYWKKGCPVAAKTPDCIASAHKARKRAIVWVVNTARKDQTVDVSVDFGGLGLSHRSTVALNAETGEAIELTRRGFSVPVLRRDFVAVHLIERQLLKGDESFYASFDREFVVRPSGRILEADEALGCSMFEPTDAPLTQGIKGQALSVGRDGVRLWPRLHLTDAEGRIAFQARLTGKPGLILSTTPRQGRSPVGGASVPRDSALAISLDKDGLAFERLESRQGAKDGQRMTAPAPGEGWHLFGLAWKGGKATLSVDGKRVGALDIQGLNIGGGTGVALTEAGKFLFGGRGEAVSAIDELRCFRPLR